MADYKAKPEPNTKQETRKGIQTDVSGPDYDKIGEQADWDAYKKENKLSFTAQRAQHKDAYNAWRTNRTKNKAQKAAVPIPAEPTESEPEPRKKL